MAISLEQITLHIDGKEVKTRKGDTVLQAAQSAGIYIPTLCADEDLEPYGGCRLCVVEIDGVRGQPTSCTTPAANGMVVRTQTPAVEKIRHTAVELIMSDHPADCLICVKNQRCDLQKVAAYLGIDQYKFKHTSRAVALDISNPFFERNLNKCILCAKCARVCDEIRGVGAIDVAYRGFTSVMATFGNKPMLDSNCISCGACVSKCPVGALYLKDDMRADREIRTICTYCGVGCGVKLGVRGGKIVSVWPDRENEVNRGYLCVKGHFGIKEMVHHSDRLTLPLIKQGNNYVKATWNEALDLVAARLGSYSKDQVAVISSSKCSNEDNYVAQKFARVALGTNNVDQCARLCHAPSMAGLAASFGNDAMTNSIKEIGDAACILAAGTNTTTSHPVLSLEIWRGVRQGRKLIVINPREIDLARWGTMWLQNRPGSDVALLMGMARIIVEERLEDREFIGQRCENYEAFKASLADYGLDFVEGVTGVPREKIVAAARMYATSRPATALYDSGITQHSHGTDNVMAVANLAMLTGNVGKPSSGVCPLRGQNNVQGACDVGALPDVYTGYQHVTNAEVRVKFENAWGCSLNGAPGLTILEMMEGAHEKKIKATYIIGENPILSEPNSRHARAGLGNLEFLVVQDIFLTETARQAHVVLPGATFAEKDGTFTNTERRVQRVRRAIEPVGESRADWWITCQIAKRMRVKGFDYESPAAIMEELARLTPSYGGISYERLEKGGIQWPCPSKEHPGTPILHAQSFTRGKGLFQPLKYRPAAEVPDKEYPLVLTTERSPYQYHTGTMTRKVGGLNLLRGEELVEINPADAEKMDIKDGEKVKVASRRGEVVAKVRITEVLPVGVVSMTFRFAEAPTNVLTNPATDPMAKTPELKVAAVRIGKLDGRKPS